MARGKSAEDLTTLQMALVGYQVERQKIQDKIDELQSKLKGKAAGISSLSGGGRGKRVLSPAARARIAAAQRKRWAEHRKKLAAAAKAAGKGD